MYLATYITYSLPDVQSGWEYLAITGKCYKVMRDTVTWEDAREACQSEITTGDLVSIPNEEVNQFISSTLIKDGLEYWVGGYQDADNGDDDDNDDDDDDDDDDDSHQDATDNWVWTDGSRVVYESWYTDRWIEPNDRSWGYDSDCDHMVWGEGKWKDRKNLEEFNYICQYDSPNGFKRRKRSNQATERIEINQVFHGGCVKQIKKREGTYEL